MESRHYQKQASELLQRANSAFRVNPFFTDLFVQSHSMPLRH